MNRSDKKGTRKWLEQLSKTTEETYVLRLYITGLTGRSLSAIETVRRVCEEHLQGRYELEIIDIYQQPMLAKGEQIIATPTLIKKLPDPLRRVIGDMSNEEKLLMGLDLRKKPNPEKARKSREKEPGD